VRTGAELLQEKVAPYFQATIINWRGEPIDNYYGREFTKKAIDMNTAVYLECLNPNCHVPRDRCENDHIVAVNKGGLSILDNLMPLCRYHNGKKADGDSYWKDDEGRTWFQPAYGDPVIC
ncbi:HNH endonuclease signature motif containing protein, partial [Corynebacterium phoceense]